MYGEHADMDNLEQYEALTQAKDWQGISELNGVFFNTFFVRKEFRALGSYLEPDEIVFAVSTGYVKNTEGNHGDKGYSSWVVVLTSERFLLIDHAFFTRSVDVRSIRLDKVQAVSTLQGWFFGKIQLDLGSRVFEIDNCAKRSVAVMSALANKWMRHREQDAKNLSADVTRDERLVGELERLFQLHQAGALSFDEYQAAKKKLIS
jgi:hypothetical protein